MFASKSQNDQVKNDSKNDSKNSQKKSCIHFAKRIIMKLIKANNNNGHKHLLGCRKLS